MQIAGLLKTSLSDYPNKVACVIFTSGCNFHCAFCHNRSLVDRSASLISEEEIFEYLNKRKGILDGVVISGGEPTLQLDILNFIKRIKQLGFLIKLDTNGSSYDIVKTLIDERLVDYIAMDIKNGPSYYDKITETNVNISEIEKTKNLLINSDIDYEFRTTLVKQYFTLESIEEMGCFLSGAKMLFLQKYVANENCINSSLDEVNEKEANEYASLLENFIENVSLRGY